MPALNQLYNLHKDKVGFYLVYIQEAHASDAWQLEVNAEEKIVFRNPQNYDERSDLACACSTNLSIEFPALVDTIENTTEAAFTAWPDRLFVIDRAGRVAYKSAAGPFGFKTNKVSNALLKLLSSDMERQEFESTKGDQ